MSWTLLTADTRLTIEAGKNAPVITHLSAIDGSNWAQSPTQVLFPSRLAVGDSLDEPNWTLLKTEFNKNPDCDQLILTYKASSYDVILESVWTAHPGPGPIQHGMKITNKTHKSITIYNPDSLDAEFSVSDPVEVFYVCKDRLAPRIISTQCHYGTYLEELTPDYNAHIWTSVDGDDTGYIPLVMLHADKEHGIYIGWEWNEGGIHVSGKEKSDGLYAGITAGLDIEFCTELFNDQEFIVPNVFIGAFIGDIDDASNRLRKWLFRYMMPEENRRNENIPYVQWNSFYNTGETHGSWTPLESKYYPMVDSIAKVGIEEVTIDVGWWQEWGDFRGHSERWSKGMAYASQYAHDHNMLFTLYFAFLDGASHDPLAFSSEGPNAHPDWMAGRWCTDWGIDECRDFMKKMILQRLQEFNVDTLRSDLSPIARTKASANKHQGCHDAPYWAQMGYIHFLDYILENKPGLRYQNCNCGGALKGYAIMKRSTTVQTTDIYFALDVRRAIYDSVYCYPMMQLLSQFGDVASGQKIGEPSYRFRSYLMAAPSAHFELPDDMPDDEMKYMAKLIETYKRRVRPLVRYADVYHVLPRPDEKVWDGLELYNPELGTGMLMVFRPENDESAIYVPLRGLESDAKYLVEYDDQTLENTEVSGQELMTKGLHVNLPKKFSSEWVFLTKADSKKEAK